MRAPPNRSRTLPLILSIVGALASTAGCRSRVPDPTEASAAAPDQREAAPLIVVEPAVNVQLEPGEPSLPGVTNSASALDAQLRGAVAAHGPEYEPRAEHFGEDGQPAYVNRLILESSPYLLQHAHNPVNWRAWGDAAFERAAELDRPVLLSIGYSTCHWCHVMEHESFEDEEIAALINENFVAIKVDREERPDVDGVYMTAVNLLTGRGGWPMTVVLTPEREPFFAGTYFPARTGDRGSRMGFLQILTDLSQRYTTDRDQLVREAAALSQRIRSASARQAPRGAVTQQTLLAAQQRFAQSFDPTWGGFGNAPKFPRPSSLFFLMRQWRESGDPAVLALVTTTLDRMAEGGMYDHVAGGFHRYSTDARWLVPHFEKMLYDNAQLAMAYVEAFQITADPFYERITRETLDYVAREMTGAHGAFWSATDADSPTPSGHREEGWFWTWTPAELSATLQDPVLLAAVTAYWNISARGNFEGRSIPHTPTPLATVAERLSITPEVLWERVVRARSILYETRLTRPPPVLDDKVIVAWNGLMISAFARAGVALGEPSYVDRAVAAAEFLHEHMLSDDGRLWRTFRINQVRHGGVLDDYAFFAQACLDLFEATGDIDWIARAIRLQDTLHEHFRAESGAYYLTPDDGEALLAREIPDYDGAEPSGNSVAALNLLRLAEFTLDERFRARAEQVMSTGRGGTVAPLSLAAWNWVLDEPLEIAIVSPEGAEPAAAAGLLDVLRSRYIPNRVLVQTTEGAVADQSAVIPWLEAKVPQGGQPTAYVCVQGVCELPTSDPTVLGAQLDARITP